MNWSRFYTGKLQWKTNLQSLTLWETGNSWKQCWQKLKGIDLLWHQEELALTNLIHMPC